MIDIFISNLLFVPSRHPVYDRLIIETFVNKGAGEIPETSEVRLRRARRFMGSSSSAD